MVTLVLESKLHKMGLFKRKNNYKKISFENFPQIGGLMVSKMVVDGMKKPLFMYREKRHIPPDSGWRIFSGYESDEYANNPDNFGIYSPSTILKIEPSIANLLLKGAGSVFERKSENSAWYPVCDFKLDDDYMVKHSITNKWFLEINNLFERSKEENGDLFYTTGDKSLRIAIWNYDNKRKSEIYEEHKKMINNRHEPDSKTLETFEYPDTEIIRIGYLIKESNKTREYDAIYGFSIVDNQVVQLAFYFDDEKDKIWALDTWKSIQYK